MPVPDDILRIAFRLPPEKAVEYLKRKGYKFSWRWQDTLAEAHEKAFTVAKVMRMDVLLSVREMIARAQTDGLTFDRFQKSLEPYLKLAGWWGRTWERNEQGDLLDADGKPFPLDDNGEPIIPDGERPPLLGSPSRLATIYQTNLQVAFMAGRYVGMMEAVNARPYWQYISVRDGRTTDLCVSLDQQVYPADDPFWSYFYPPNHWRCRARVRSLSDRDLKRKQLDVSSSKGKLGSEQVVISKRTGETGDISTLQVGDHVLRNDPSFNYNPGKKAFEPDLKKYPKELQKAFKREKREKRK